MAQSHRLGSQGMFDLALYQIIHAAPEENPDAKAECKFNLEEFADADGQPAYVAHIEINGQRFSLFNPACDNSQVTQESAGTSPFPSLLDKINGLEEQDAKSTFIIPLAECRDDRLHWVLLVKHQGEWHLYDPKAAGFFFPYGLDHLVHNYLSTNPLKQENIHYTNLQSLWNDTHCGYYVAFIIKHIIKTLMTGQPLKSMQLPIARSPTTALEEEYNQLSAAGSIPHPEISAMRLRLLQPVPKKIPALDQAQLQIAPPVPVEHQAPPKETFFGWVRKSVFYSGTGGLIGGAAGFFMGLGLAFLISFVAPPVGLLAFPWIVGGCAALMGSLVGGAVGHSLSKRNVAQPLVILDAPAQRGGGRNSRDIGERLSEEAPLVDGNKVSEDGFEIIGREDSESSEDSFQSIVDLDFNNGVVVAPSNEYEPPSPRR